MTGQFLVLSGFNYLAHGRFGAGARIASNGSERLLRVERSHSCGSAAFWLTNTLGVAASRGDLRLAELLKHTPKLRLRHHAQSPHPGDWNYQDFQGIRDADQHSSCTSDQQLY
jgi:hypothetical protein